ncbi:MAG: histidinol-phosphate transaminase [Alphaproteobacteria bacterium]|nr:histidinol-phosphate transaminase [Alphaproteobacteria bacterium]
MTAPTPKPGILDIELYVGGRSSVPGAAKVYKLSSNESALGPSPLAVAALTAAAHDLERYPDGSSRLLRDAIARAYEIDAERIVVGGEGSGPLLTMIANAYLTPGDEAVFSRHAFLLYEIATRANSAKPVIVAEKVTNSGIRIDVEAMLAAVTAKTRLVYIANPNNPTGSYLTRDEIKRLHAGLPANVLLVIDAAYGEFCDAPDYDTGLELARDYDNVVMTRTFSKIHGLAALRLGWAFVPRAVADVLNRIRGPFPTSPLQQQAGAAAILDTAHVARTATHNAKWRTWLINEIRGLGLKVDDSAANFVLIHFSPGARDAKAADAFLIARGVILRGVGAYGLPDALRLTVGSEEANRAAVAALQEFMG